MGFALYAAQRIGAPRLLIALFGIWAIPPFVMLAVGRRASKCWSPLPQAMVFGVTPVVAAASSIIQGVVSFGVSKPKTLYSSWLLPVSWLLITIVIGTAALRSRQASFRRKMRRVYELKDTLGESMDTHSMLMAYRPMSQLLRYYVVPEIEARVAAGKLSAADFPVQVVRFRFLPP